MVKLITFLILGMQDLSVADRSNIRFTSTSFLCAVQARDRNQGHW
jgi:hypothetical protein